MKTLYDDKSGLWIAEEWAHGRLVIAEGETMIEAMNSCAEMVCARIVRNHCAGLIYEMSSISGMAPSSLRISAGSTQRRTTNQLH